MKLRHSSARWNLLVNMISCTYVVITIAKHVCKCSRDSFKAVNISIANISSIRPIAVIMHLYGDKAIAGQPEKYVCKPDCGWSLNRGLDFLLFQTQALHIENFFLWDFDMFILIFIIVLSHLLHQSYVGWSLSFLDCTAGAFLQCFTFLKKRNKFELPEFHVSGKGLIVITVWKFWLLS